ncbi:MAG: xanthine dehydrogenase family protein molybdopterin-binding subunit [Proteobacteria bacterium]|nr:xanthine dehydrogenase family protein molybdopterin-binding subunit [Pseudomonadota bacterium]
MSEATAMSGVTKYIGVSRKRSEDPVVLMGRAKYVDDIALPGMVEVAFLRSTHAHARIKRVDVSKAEGHADCLGLVTGDEFDQGTTTFFPGTRGELKPVSTPFIARDKVRYVGEIIAVVVAPSRYIAEDIVDLIEVEYEKLPAYNDVEDAMQDGATPLHEELGGNVYYSDSYSSGDVAKAFKDADLVVSEKFTTGRTSAAPMETRGVIAEWSWDEKLTVWSSTQMPYPLRTQISHNLGIPEQIIRVIAPTVGGGFGQKAHFFPEEFILPWLAKRIKKPLKWIEDRREHLLCAAHAKQNTIYMEIAMQKDGVILGMKIKNIGDSGAYSQYPWSGLIESLAANTGAPGAFRVENIEYETRVVLTNKMSTGAYRGIGWSAGCYAREMALTKAAKLLDLDLSDIYFKNLIRSDEFPYTTATNQVYDSGDYHKVLDKCLELSDYRNLKKLPRLGDNGKLRGVGCAFFVEQTNWGSRSAQESGFPATLHDTTTVEMDPGGKVTVRSGQFSHGQGHRTTLAQVAAETLGVLIEDVVVIDGDTETGAYGMGTFASRSAVIGGGTVIRAATDVRNKLIKIAAHVMEAHAADLTIDDGQIFVKGSPGHSISVAEIAHITYFDRFRRPDENEVEPTLSSTRHYDPPAAYANGSHAVIIELDPQLGTIDIKRIIAVEDCGNMINPKIVDGQMRGGVAQGIGLGLLEHLDYDANGQLRNTSFMDFLIPNAMTLPDIECAHVITPSPYTEGGFKGAGEAAMLSIHIALANAVADALSDYGTAVPTVTPLGPQQIMDLINQQAAD